MPQTYTQIYLHFVWSTKNRQPLITPEIRSILLKHIAASCRELKVVLHRANAAADHMHVSLSPRPEHAPADIAKQLKGSSSHYINTKHRPEGAPPFYWQEGYGVVSFRRSDLPAVVAYIDNQEERHRAGKTWPELETVELVEG